MNINEICVNCLLDMEAMASPAWADPADAAEMLHEMGTVGVSMAVLVTVVWLGMLGVSALIEKRALKAEPAKA